MIKWILHRMVTNFEKKFSYDAAYHHDIIDTSTSAGLRSLGLSMLTQMYKPEFEIWMGASLASVLDGDCGSCAQLYVDIAEAAGTSPDDLVSCINGKADEAGKIGLGFKFAEAAINDRPDLDQLRSEIVSAFGKEALVSAGYAAATARAYPVLKRALGYGHACMKLRIGNELIAINGDNDA